MQNAPSENAVKSIMHAMNQVATSVTNLEVRDTVLYEKRVDVGHLHTGHLAASVPPVA